MKKFITLILIIFFVCGSVNAEFESIIEESDEEYVETIAGTDVPDLNARSAILYDMTYDRILFEKNSKQRRANASTTKMITELVAYEYGNLDDIVEVSKNAANTGGSSIDLKSGDKVTLSDLINGLMIHSGNDSAVAIAEYVAGNEKDFAKMMNEKAREIGAVDTNFTTPHRA